MFAAFWLNDDECNWFITRPESWNHKASPEEVLAYTATVPGWDKVADRVIRATPADSIVDWKLMWRDPQPQWTSPGGYVVQVGDAAHTFLPSSGNGGTQAIEDAVSLATCISIAGKDRIPEATRVHNLLRFERVSCLQAFGVTNKDKMSNSKTDEKKRGKSPLHLARWIWDHEPEAYAVAKYDEAVAQLTTGSPMKHTNTPPGLVYKPWTIETLLAAQVRGEPTILDGQWD
nr:fad-dependent monooxygenase mdpd [Quercus suber]